MAAASKKRFVLVGTGGRCVMYIDALAGEYRERGQLLALCDPSATRMAYYNRRLAEQFKHPPLATYPASDFDRMIREQRPDGVIVTTMDSTHHQYIVRSMELGCDVICEKPMTTDAERARAIFDAIARTGRKLRVTFNYRYTPHATKMRQLVEEGTIGTPLAVDFSWVLDTSHGADYFRRWHSQKDKSGGLLVHKASHHFDLINWWIDSYPRTVFAMGDLKFYGRANAIARGDADKTRYPRYLNEPLARNDPFALKWEEFPTLMELYGGQAEKETGYIRDRNVFGDHITIEDTMAITARYRNGVILNYSLIAYSPWEGFRVAITGNKGRLELYVRHGSHIIAGQSDQELAAQQAREAAEALTVFPMFGLPYQAEIPPAEGGHGGADPVMIDQIFNPEAPADRYHRAASHVDGAASCLLGIAANRSMITGQPVNVDDLLKLP